MIKKITYTLIIFFSCSFISCSNLHNKNNIKEQDISTIEDIEIINKQENITMEYILDNLTSDEFEGRFTGSNGNKLAEQFIEDIFNNIELDKVFNTDNYKHTYIQEISDTPGLQNADSKTEFKEINNIIGKISGKDSKRAIIISAHFDHIGKQGDEIFRGAVDNGSGVAILIDLAQKLQIECSEMIPDYDIIFCAFNGEEEGLQGSKAFVRDIMDKYESLTNINIDSVGYEKGGDIIFLRRNSEATNITQQNLYTNIEKALNKNGLNVSEKEIKGVSDNASFENEGIANICLIEENVKEIIHSVSDTIDVINFDNLNSISNSIYYFLKNYIILS